LQIIGFRTRIKPLNKKIPIMNVYSVSNGNTIVFMATNLKAALAYIIAYTPEVYLKNIKSYSQYVRDIAIKKHITISVSPGVFYFVQKNSLKKKFRLSEYD
jgi:hypothetical protein